MYFDVNLNKEVNDWKKFENDSADIFEKFNYTVDRDVRFKTNRRFQIDFIAYDDKRIFFVDCKNHSYIPPEKEKEFIKNQIKRARNFLKLKNENNRKNIVILVTKNKTNSLLEHKEGIGKIFSVDFYSLPTLLRDIDIYEEELLSF